MAKQDAASRKNDGGKDEPGLVNTVELGDQNNRHDCESHQHCSRQEGLVILLVLRAASECQAYARVEVERWQFLSDAGDEVIYQVSGINVGIDRYGAAHIDTLNISDFLCGHTLDKGAYRNQSLFGRNSQAVYLREIAAVLRVADADIDFVVTVVGPVFPDLYPVRDKLHHCADQ